MEGLIFFGSTLPLVPQFLQIIPRDALTPLVILFTILIAACLLTGRPNLLFPILVVASLGHSTVPSLHAAALCGSLLIVHECMGRWAAWGLACASLWIVSTRAFAYGAVYMIALEHFTWWPPFVYALDAAERHMCASLLMALASHVYLWPNDDFSLPAFLVLGLFSLGAFLGATGPRKPVSFFIIAGLFAAGSFVCARIMAGHWMFAWAIGRVIALRVEAIWILVVLLPGLGLIVWFVQDRKDALGFADRKLFHALIVAVFSQAILRNPSSVWIPALTLASFAAFCLLYLIELVRAFSGMGEIISAWYGRWIDDRDSKAVIATTHLQLLLGCAVPVWICRGSVPVAVCGIATIGVGDSMAAIVGSRWGRHRWSVSNKRTLEGSVAMAVSTALAFGIFAHAHLSLLTIARVSVCVALMEAHTHSRDNLLLPLFAASIV